MTPWNKVCFWKVAFIIWKSFFAELCALVSCCKILLLLCKWNISTKVFSIKVFSSKLLLNTYAKY